MERISVLCGSYQISVFFVLYSLTLLDRLVFWLHNLLCFAFVDIYHGLVVPLRFSFHYYFFSFFSTDLICDICDNYEVCNTIAAIANIRIINVTVIYEHHSHRLSG